MLTERDKYMGIRYATSEEEKDYYIIDKMFDEMDSELVTKIIDIIGDYVTAYKPKEVNRSYNRVYYYAKKFGVTVKMLTNWYYID